MSSHSNHQNQALTILAIATATLGFGVFGAEFRVGQILFNYGLSADLARMKLLSGFLALVYYWIVLASVQKALKQDDNVTGRQVAEGPLAGTIWVVVFIALIFVIGIFEEPVPKQ